MNRKSRLLAAAIAGVMVLGMLSGCTKKPVEQTSAPTPSATSAPTSTPTQAQKGPSYLNKTGFPIVKEPITLKGMVNVSPTQGDYSQIMVWTEYEKMTGIKIEWTQVPSANITEKRNLALASGDLPDFFYRMGITDNDLMKYGEQGTFVKLNDLINEYGPNFKKVMETKPDVKKAVPAYNGAIYGLPTLTDGLTFQVNPKIFINKVWLDNLGLKMPANLDELEAMLKAFKEKDPNKNGKADEIPWSGYSWQTQLVDVLKGAWGLGNRGRGHKNVDIDPKTNELRFIPTTAEFKELLAYLNKLYSEGLIDQEIYTMKSTQVVGKVAQNIVGMVNVVNTAFLGADHGPDFAGISASLKGPKGDQLYSAISSGMGAKGAFVVTNKNKHLEATMRWIDYFYGDEGIRFFYMGVEGKSYYKTTDGKYEYLPEIVNNIPTGSSFDQVIAKYTPYGGGGSPTIVKPEYFKGGETQPAAMSATAAVEPYLVKEIWGPFSFSSEESEKKNTLETDIQTYIDQMVPAFIQGKEPLSKWDDYVAQIKKMGLDDYMKLYKAGYERYNKN